MKKIIIYFILIAFIAIVVGTIGCLIIVNANKVDNNEIKTFNISLEQNDDFDISSLNLDVGLNNLEIISNLQIEVIGNFLTFIEYGDYEIKFKCKNDIIAKLYANIYQKINSLSFNINDCVMFLNKGHNSTPFTILDNDKEVSIEYLDFQFDENIVDIQSNNIIAKSVGTTTLVAKHKDISANLTINIYEWNYAKSLNLDKTIYDLAICDNPMKLQPHIEYLNNSDFVDDVTYEIISGHNLIELNGNAIIPKVEGVAKIKIEIPKNETQYLSEIITINVHPKISLQISILDSENKDITILKSGTKFDGTYELYTLHIYSNSNLTSIILSKIIKNIKDNYSQYIQFLGDYEIEDNICNAKCYFINNGNIDFQAIILEEYDNYLGYVVSNNLPLLIINFVNDLQLSINHFVDKNNEIYYPSCRIENEKKIYTIYNAQGDNDALTLAILDRKPYYLTFSACVDFSIGILEQVHRIQINGNTITRVMEGYQNLKLTALDGSNYYEIITIEILNIPIEYCDLSNLPSEYNLFLNGINELKISPNYIPAYASGKPELSVTINDFNINAPCLEYEKIENEYILRALQTTTLPISVYIQNVATNSTHNISIMIYEKNWELILLNSSREQITEIKQDAGNNYVRYYILLSGIELANISLEYRILDPNSLEWKATLIGINIDSPLGDSIIINLSSTISTKIKFIINSIYSTEFNISSN